MLTTLLQRWAEDLDTAAELARCSEWVEDTPTTLTTWVPAEEPGG